MNIFVYYGKRKGVYWYEYVNVLSDVFLFFGSFLFFLEILGYVLKIVISWIFYFKREILGS